MSGSTKCQDCGYTFLGDDIDKETGKRIPCPKCGSLNRKFIKNAEVKIGVKTEMIGILKTNMTPESWTIFGLILGLITPPIFYIVFSTLDINIGYKLLIWLGLLIIIFLLIRSFRFIHFLRWLADKAYGKQKIS